MFEIIASIILKGIKSLIKYIKVFLDKGKAKSVINRLLPEVNENLLKINFLIQNLGEFNILNEPLRTFENDITEIKELLNIIGCEGKFNSVKQFNYGLLDLNQLVIEVNNSLFEIERECNKEGVSFSSLVKNGFSSMKLYKNLFQICRFHRSQIDKLINKIRDVILMLDEILKHK